MNQQLPKQEELTPIVIVIGETRINAQLIRKQDKKGCYCLVSGKRDWYPSSMIEYVKQ